ncbi:MAG: DUF6602 domain-containing protein [Leptolyngbya sp. BL-A-14]
MPVETSFVEYHKSMAAELKAVKDRIRHLIGSNHWLTDGEHKEAVVRKFLRTYLPETFHIGRGFICYSDGTVSTQIDILVTDKNKPTLFKDGELVIVTPDSVEAILEVKTRQDSNCELVETLEKLAEQVGKVRCSSVAKVCWSGLFVFDANTASSTNRRSRNPYRDALTAIRQASMGDKKKVVNCLALGSDLFVRFWFQGSEVNNPVNGSVWHSYKLRDLAHAYFLSNAVWGISRGVSSEMQYAWFPIENGKEVHREWFIGLEDHEPQRF